MGHRALVAYQRTDGLFNLHFSHWGAHDLELVSSITPDTPFGGDSMEPTFVTGLLAALDDADLTAEGQLADAPADTPVDPRPRATGLTFAEVVAKIDYLFHEAVYVVEYGFENVVGYTTLDTHFSEHDYESERGGLLVTPRYYNGEPIGLGILNGFFTGAKAVVNTEIHEGVISPGGGERRLTEHVLERVKESSSEVVCPYSSGVQPDDWNDYQTAFFRPTSQSASPRGFLPSGPICAPAWSFPDDFPPVRTTTDDVPVSDLLR